MVRATKTVTPFWRWIIILMVSLCSVSLAGAQDKVVVIPLLGDGATGNATPEDVLDGKTFSNSNAAGLSGTRPPTPVQKTGQTDFYRSGDDGYHESGESWVYPRFTRGQYIVTDNITGLVWEQSANSDDGLSYWNEAIDYCNILSIEEPAGIFSITYDDWRLPSVKELQSLINFKYTSPALSNTYGNVQWINNYPFTQLATGGKYWSSTTYAADTANAWVMDIADGSIDNSWEKNHIDYRSFVWCVHDGN